MAVNIVSKKDNPLLKREELWCVVEHHGKATPARDELIPELSKSLNKDPELIIVDKIFSIKGRGESRVKVFIYKSKEDIPKEKLEKLEKRMAKRKKKAGQEEQKEQTEQESNEKKEESENEKKEENTENDAEKNE